MSFRAATVCHQQQIQPDVCVPYAALFFCWRPLRRAPLVLQLQNQCLFLPYLPHLIVCVRLQPSTTALTPVVDLEARKKWARLFGVKLKSTYCTFECRWRTTDTRSELLCPRACITAFFVLVLVGITPMTHAPLTLKEDDDLAKKIQGKIKEKLLQEYIERLPEDSEEILPVCLR